MSHSRYWEEPPAGGFRSVVEGWRFSEDESKPPAIRVLPDGEVTVLFSAPASGEAWEAALLGATTRASIVMHEEPRLQIQARLAVGAAASILDADLRELRDRVVPLCDVWGARTAELLDILARSRSWRERRSAIEAAFARASETVAPSSDLACRATREIRSARGSVRIGELCDLLGVAPRQLERAFAYDLGVSPKLLARIVRFRNAREALRMGRPATQIAHWAGYSDQAHMTREFREFAGVPPSLLGSAVVFVQASAGGEP